MFTVITVKIIGKLIKEEYERHYIHLFELWFATGERRGIKNCTSLVLVNSTEALINIKSKIFYLQWAKWIYRQND